MSTPSPFESARLGPVILRNRLIKAATFEGMSPRGEVSDELVAMNARHSAGSGSESRCIPCNRCVVEMEIDGTRCVVADAGA